MFEHLRHHSRILVTGPQRSGTTICAAMIAEDTGHKFYTEERVNIGHLESLRQLIKTESNFVIQCPALCRYVHLLDTTVVLMRRAIEDIIASEERIGWQGHRRGELAKYGKYEGVISEVKYEFWEQFQRYQIKSYYEIEYESLSGHPLWLPKEQRRDFGPRQIG